MIRKTIIQPDPGDPKGDLNLEEVASFEISSEAEGFPFENALRPDPSRWKAGERGRQTIRVNFDAPRRITQIRLEFDEKEISRTQEFVIRWKQARTGKWSELRRQQFNFSAGTTREVETLELDLAEVAALELRITPSLSFEEIASLTSLRVK